MVEFLYPIEIIGLREPCLANSLYKDKPPVNPVKLGDVVDDPQKTRYTHITLTILVKTRVYSVFMYLIVLFGLSIGWTPLAHAAPKEGEIKVKLFGQTCLLQGLTTAEVLSNVHAISPEQIYPDTTRALSADSFRHALEKLRKTTIPSGLDHYRERLGRRFEKQVLFLSLLQKAKGDSAAAPVLGLKKELPSRAHKEFDSLARKNSATRSAESLQEVFDFFSDQAEPDPEEEFHRVLKKSGIHYTCSFEEDSAEEGQE